MTTRIPIKHLFDVTRNMITPSDYGNQPLFHYSLPAWHEYGDGIIENASDLASGKLLLKGGEVLVSKLNPEKSAVLLAKSHEIPTVCSPEFIALVPKKIERQFAYYFMLSEPLRHQLNASVESVTNSHKRARVDRFLASYVDLPDVVTQREIADFLDRETARIDLLIEKKQQLVKLLEEKKSAKISSSISYYPSTKRLKNSARILNGYAFKSELFGDHGVPVVRQSNLKSGKIVHDGRCYPSELTPSGFILKEGDLCIGMSGSIENFGVVSSLDLPAALNQRVGALRAIDKKCLQEVLPFYVQSRIFKDHISRNLPSTTIVNIDAHLILNAPFPDLTLQEQFEMVEMLSVALRQLARTLDAVDQSIDRLKEYRSALITAAVTGQIDLQNYTKSGVTERQLDAIQEEMDA